MADENKYKAKSCPIQRNGDAETSQIKASIKKPLFIIFWYSGTGAASFQLAAELKKKRLDEKYPHADVRVIPGFEHRVDFHKRWTELYNELMADTAVKLELWQMHYFGHGTHDSIALRNYIDVTFDERDDEWECLPWHPEQGIFVMHTCRGAAYEDWCYDTKIDEKDCIANRISVQQQTRCLGQVVYGSYAGFTGYKVAHDINAISAHNLFGTTLVEFTPEELIETCKYRTNYVTNYIRLLDSSTKRVLWGYALLTADSGTKIKALKIKYEEEMKTTYPIYVGVEKLASANQIFPCRVFNCGKEESRVVELHVFNQNDLDYI